MSYAIIIRGPLGVGKSTIAEILAKELKAKHISIDKILDEENIEEWEDGYVSKNSFIKANEIAVQRAKKELENEIPVIFDGNFYFKSQIEDLVKRLNFKSYIFTLKAPVEVCIDRDNKRCNGYGEDAAKAVHKKVSEFDEGIIIDTENKTPNQTIKEILKFIK